MKERESQQNDSLADSCDVPDRSSAQEAVAEPGSGGTEQKNARPCMPPSKRPCRLTPSCVLVEDAVRLTAIRGDQGQHVGGRSVLNAWTALTCVLVWMSSGSPHGAGRFAQ